MKNIKIFLPVILLLVGLGAGFFAGIKYQQSHRGSLARQFANGQGQRAGAIMGTGTGNRVGFRPISGEIITSDDKSITIKLADGSSKIILISDKTVINKVDAATKEDLKSGERVAVFGQENSDRTVSAQNIQLNPVDRILPQATPAPAQ